MREEGKTSAAARDKALATSEERSAAEAPSTKRAQGVVDTGCAQRASVRQCATHQHHQCIDDIYMYIIARLFSLTSSTLAGTQVWLSSVQRATRVV